ncbi:MAG: NAD(P)H-hydrate dehydratase, partial [Rhizobacter sp.]|nr:NAD(P)H-hydrate dehydratase [Rhizobacter sp.]
ATTMVATPDGECWRHVGQQAGLGTSGSGDVLAGLIVGLAARGAPLAQAAAWAVFLHANAGATLAERRGPVGYLASELAAEVPALMASLAR